ncbi:hypothetical protein RHSP_83047 [Rhizobium freirei PRF 81]|uniref:Uncharacterized protein n=1 Tax=Rhizobium freirei PRF 81 TaxID=363754 RepID=N6VA02_9HYPH|nr:hypothetical protein RHSP_83047 [Rhizobium freirei PRF 81]
MDQISALSSMSNIGRRFKRKGVTVALFPGFRGYVFDVDFERRHGGRGGSQPAIHASIRRTSSRMLPRTLESICEALDSASEENQDFSL